MSISISQYDSKTHYFSLNSNQKLSILNKTNEIQKDHGKARVILTKLTNSKETLELPEGWTINDVATTILKGYEDRRGFCGWFLDCIFEWLNISTEHKEIVDLANKVSQIKILKKEQSPVKEKFIIDHTQLFSDSSDTRTAYLIQILKQDSSLLQEIYPLLIEKMAEAPSTDVQIRQLGEMLSKVQKGTKLSLETFITPLAKLLPIQEEETRSTYAKLMLNIIHYQQAPTPQKPHTAEVQLMSNIGVGSPSRGRTSRRGAGPRQGPQVISETRSILLQQPLPPPDFTDKNASELALMATHKLIELRFYVLAKNVIPFTNDAKLTTIFEQRSVAEKALEAMKSANTDEEISEAEKLMTSVAQFLIDHRIANREATQQQERELAKALIGSLMTYRSGSERITYVDICECFLNRDFIEAGSLLINSDVEIKANCEQALNSAISRREYKKRQQEKYKQLLQDFSNYQREGKLQDFLNEINDYIQDLVFIYDADKLNQTLNAITHAEFSTLDLSQLSVPLLEILFDANQPHYSKRVESLNEAKINLLSKVLATHVFADIPFEMIRKCNLAQFSSEKLEHIFPENEEGKERFAKFSAEEIQPILSNIPNYLLPLIKISDLPKLDLSPLSNQKLDILFPIDENLLAQTKVKFNVLETSAINGIWNKLNPTRKQLLSDERLQALTTEEIIPLFPELFPAVNDENKRRFALLRQTHVAAILGKIDRNTHSHIPKLLSETQFKQLEPDLLLANRGLLLNLFFPFEYGPQEANKKQFALFERSQVQGICLDLSEDLIALISDTQLEALDMNQLKQKDEKKLKTLLTYLFPQFSTNHRFHLLKIDQLEAILNVLEGYHFRYFSKEHLTKINVDLLTSPMLSSILAKENYSSL